MASIERAEREGMRATDIGPAPPVPRSMTVRVDMENGHARIRTKDGVVDMVVPSGVVRRRLPAGETLAYFRASSAPGTDVVELGDRVENQGW